MDAKKMTNEELAAILYVMGVSGICPSRDERDYLEEAADRLMDRMQPMTNTDIYELFFERTSIPSRKLETEKEILDCIKFCLALKEDVEKRKEIKEE